MAHSLRNLVTLSIFFLPATLALSTTSHHPPPPPTAETTTTTTTTTAQDIITALNLTANPEKGYYTQTFIDDTLNVTYAATTANGTGHYMTTRAASTAIYYLLEGKEGDSYWHRHDGLEVWHYYAGAPLLLRRSWDEGEPVREMVLGGHVVGGGGGGGEKGKGKGQLQRPQGFVERWEWQSARSLGEWTLVGTTVAPAFSADPGSYEVAAAGWEPSGA